MSCSRIRVYRKRGREVPRRANSFQNELVAAEGIGATAGIVATAGIGATTGPLSEATRSGPTWPWSKGGVRDHKALAASNLFPEQVGAGRREGARPQVL